MRPNLATAAAERTQRALAQGALAPIDTHATLVRDGGEPFVVRVIDSLRRKRTAAGGVPEGDPFSPPYEPALFLGDLTATHAVLLNKFPVLREHLLLVTRAYEDQQEALTTADCEALLLGLAEIEGLAFYNGGHVAGASQPHKHLQLVPLPLSDTGPPLPAADALAATRFDGELGRTPAWPFPHRIARLEPDWLRDPTAGGAALAARYRRMLAALGLTDHGTGTTPRPYNLLATREWLWMVPRTREFAAGVSVNALGFAGTLLVPDDRKRDDLLRAGPMRVLTEVCEAGTG